MKMPEQIKCTERDRTKERERDREREGEREGATQERARDLFLAIEI